jgi:hypothetical protein
MRNVALLTLLILPIISQDTLADNLPSSIRRAVELKRTNSFCELTDPKKTSLNEQAKAINKGRSTELSTTVLNDLEAADTACTPESRDAEAEARKDIVAQAAEFPVQILANFTGLENLFKLDAVALEFIKSREANVCKAIPLAQTYNRDLWHSTLLKSGWKCIAENAINLAQSFNEGNQHSNAQSRLQELNGLSLQELKVLFRQKHAANPFKIGFVPQLSWENGVLNTTFPYSLLTSPTELTSYRKLIKEFKKLGVKSVLINRNSMTNLKAQVKETSSEIRNLGEKHVIISRSMGARVMREILVNNEKDVVENISTVLNVGGTPHGSVIAASKSRPDAFYLDTFQAILGGLKLPIDVIALDPRIPNHIKATLFSALERRNLETMSPIEPRLITESNVKVLNAQFIRKDHVRATKGVDPVWLDMLLQGPTEGSAPIHGSTIDTSDSIRTVLPGDHLEFWKLTPDEALAVYLRLLILSDEEGLI